jgi:hypothetical protein
VEVLVTGAGAPVSAFLPGLTGSIAQTRPFGSGVEGTRVFAHLAPCGPDGGYPMLGRQVRAVLDAVGATGAVGVSMGAGALLAALAQAGATAGDTFPVRRLVLCLPPAAPGGPPPAEAVVRRFAAMADALDAADVEGLARLLRAHQPAAVRRLPAVVLWARRHAADLVAARAAGLATMLRALPGEIPPAPATALDTLVIAQEGDKAHPVEAARCWATLLGARLEVLPPGSVPWRGRAELRRLISAQLRDH